MAQEQKIKAVFVAAVQRAENGVDFSPRFGAVCPFCGRPNLRVHGSKPWDGDCRIRYHRCHNPGCYLHQIGQTIKSVQVD